MEVEGTISLASPSPTPIIPEFIEEAYVPEESVSVPLVHTETTGSTEDIQIVEHPTVVQEGLDANTINDLANV